MARKREKILEKYNEENLVRIEGKGMSATTIMNTYLQYIEEEGFTLTVEEIANYLRVSYQYVTETVLPSVLHIRINESARSIIMKELNRNNEESEYYSLFMKRVLFQQESFQTYLTEQAQHEVIYKKFYRQDFDEQLLSRLGKQLETYNQKMKKPISLSFLLQQVMDSFIPKHFIVEPTYQPLRSFPAHLLSQRDIMETYGLPYKVSFYRYLEKKGINKVKIGNLVRYLPTELEEKAICVAYEGVYQRLPKDPLSFSLFIEKRAEEWLKK